MMFILLCLALQMTKIVLPQMRERNKGAIINISSLSGVLPTPLLSVYSCCKVCFISRISLCFRWCPSVCYSSICGCWCKTNFEGQTSCWLVFWFTYIATSAEHKCTDMNRTVHCRCLIYDVAGCSTGCIVHLVLPLCI